MVVEIFVFLVGQYFLHFVFYPFKEFKITLSKIHYYLKLDSGYLTNSLRDESCKLDLFKSNKQLLDETRKHFRNLGCELSSSYGGLSFWSGFIFWNIPTEKSIIKAVSCLIRLSNSAGDPNHLLENADAIDEIKRILKLT